ncbi:MAG: preprotein translocase subunit SecE [Methylococcaceae bacterium]
MTAKIETKPVRTFDTIKLIFAVLLLVAGVAGYYYYSEQLLVYRVFGILIVSASALILILNTVNGKNLLVFLRESRVEVKKMIWPTKEETLQATMMVVGIVFLMGITLWLLDMFLFWSIGRLTGIGS